MNLRFSDMNLPRFPLLGDEETKDLIARAQQGDETARERLVNCNLRLVFNLIQRFTGRGYELEDIFQIGTIGLMKAIDKFDLSYDVRFSTYAVPMIVGEIRRFMRDDHPVKISRSIKEAAIKLHHSKEKLSKELGREPTINELALDTGLGPQDIVTTLEASQSPASIFETIYQDEGDPIYLLDHIKSEEQNEGAWFDKMALKEVLMKLQPRDRTILLMRFFEDKTQAQVAEYLNLSQVQVSRLERHALKQLKELLVQDH